MKMSTERKLFPKGVCLLSGGMDSCVSAAIAVKECEEVFFLHITYGQLTAKKEQQAFDNICNHFAIPLEQRIQGSLPCLNEFGGSTLLTSSKKPVGIHNEHGKNEIPDTYVPFRNGTLLSLAAGLAEAKGAGAIYIGAVEEDSSGYPDCRKIFFESFQKAINKGTKPDTFIEIRTPVIHLNKKDIILLAKKMNAPIEHSWSCYTSEDRACGKCDSCTLRLNAFARAGIKDPIPYVIEDRK